MAQSDSVPVTDPQGDNTLGGTDHRLDSQKKSKSLKFKDVLFMCLSIVVGAIHPHGRE